MLQEAYENAAEFIELATYLHLDGQLQEDGTLPQRFSLPEEFLASSRPSPTKCLSASSFPEDDFGASARTATSGTRMCRDRILSPIGHVSPSATVERSRGRQRDRARRLRDCEVSDLFGGSEPDVRLDTPDP